MEPARGLPILLVEDHRPTLEVLRRFIAGRGFPVVVAANATEARQVIASTSVGFLVSDLGLPDGDGCELMAQLREEHGITGVALSGYGTPADKARCAAAGFTAHFTKPIEIAQLQQILALAERELPPAGGPRPD